MTKVRLPDKFECLFEPSRYKGFYGGRGSAKSHSFATALVLLGAQKPMRILCCREIQRSIRDSVKRLIDDKIVECGLENFYTSTLSDIRGKNGTLFLFSGLRSNPESIKSMEGIDVCWVEEASTVSRRSLDFLIPTIRKEDSEIWFSWNPDSAEDPVDKMFRGQEPPPESVVEEVGYADNPWFPNVLNLEMEYDKKIDDGKYRHIWLGEYADVQDGKMFTEDFLAWQREHLEKGETVGDWTIYKDFNRKNRYGIGADVAEGVGLDSSTAVVIDFTEGEVVAVFASNTIEPDLFGYELHNYSKAYGNGIIGVERNNCGLTTVTKLKELSANLYAEKEHASGLNKGTRNLGWRTTAKSKPLMLYDLKDALVEKHIKLVSKPLFKELKTYDPDNLRQTRFDPEQTKHWDRVMACFVKGTLVLTDEGQKPIETIKVGDKVLTRKGYKKVIANISHMKKVTTNIGLTGTPDHPIFCNNKIKDLSGVSNSDKLHIWNPIRGKIQRKSYTEVLGIIDILNQKCVTTGFITEGVQNVRRKMFTYIGRFGLIILGTFQMAISFIIRIITHLITLLRTWSVYLYQNIVSVITKKKRVENGLQKTERRLLKEYADIMRAKKEERSSVKFVERLSKALLLMQNFVVTGVQKIITIRKGESLKRRRFAIFAVRDLKQASQTKGGAQKNAARSGEGSNTLETVYNLQVEGCPEYFANNILVHNCAIAWQMRDQLDKGKDSIQSVLDAAAEYANS